MFDTQLVQVYYLKIVLKYNTWVNVFSYLQPEMFSTIDPWLKTMPLYLSVYTLVEQGYIKVDECDTASELW